MADAELQVAAACNHTLGGSKITDFNIGSGDINREHFRLAGMLASVHLG